MTKANIHDSGNGLPSIGSLCYDAATDTVYLVVAWDGSDRISAHGAGVGNSVSVLLEDIGSASDMTDEQWEEITSANYRVVCA